MSNSPLNASVKPALSDDGVQQVRSLRDQLEAMYQLEAAQPSYDDESPDVSEKALDFLRYCADKRLMGQWVPVRQIRQNWASRNDVKGEALIHLLDALTLNGWGQWQDTTQRCWMPTFDPSTLD